MCRIASIAAMMVGGFAVGLGAILLDDDLTFRLGLLLIVAGAVCFLRREMHARADELERARQAGYDDGYADGREVARPAVIPLPYLRSSCDRPSLLPDPSAAKKLREKRDLGRRPQRVLDVGV